MVARPPGFFLSSSRSLPSWGRDQPLGSELDFLRSIACDGLANLVAVAIVYFFVVMAVLVGTAPSEVLVVLLLQKGLYTVLLVAIFFRVRARTVPGRYYNALLTLILALCLSSAIVTAMMGVASPLATYTFILILGCALMDISYAWATFHWLSIWVAWLVVSTVLPNAGGVNHLSELKRWPT